jgi:hypothetical protein
MAAPSQSSTKPFSFQYRYPLTKLSSSDDYLKITFLKYIPPGFSKPGFAAPSSDDTYLAGDSRDKVDILGIIFLPIPDGVKTANITQWGSSNFNPLQVGIADLMQKAFNTNKKIDINEIQGQLPGLFSKGLETAASGSVQKFINAATITAASNILLNGNVDINQAFSRYAGAVTNSNVELVFGGVQLREAFSFGYTIVPRSKKEAEEVKKIIVAFKKHSAAKKRSIDPAVEGLFLGAPDVFKLEYMNGGQPHPYLNKFKICALIGVGVNYSGSETYATYDDATPVSMQLVLSFQELTPIYAEDYDNTTGTGY